MAAARVLVKRALLEKPGIKRFDSTDAIGAAAQPVVDVGAAGAVGGVASAAAAWRSPWLTWCGVAVGLLVRHACSLHPYSGEGTPPRFGDYEAHRHWMEVTVNLPLKDWYRHDVEYWGLDYPPLMAYIEGLLGVASRRFDPASVALGSSRGYETRAHRAWMRATVLALDAACFLSAVVFLARALHKTEAKRGALVALCALSPALVLVDHGHFQYNCVPLGLSLWAAGLVDARRPLLAAAAFALALNAKQTALYYAPAIFLELLGRCVAGGGSFSRRDGLGGAGAGASKAVAARVAALGAVVVVVFAAVWAPLLRSGAAPDALRRCFPFERGVFEDKVANFWYVAAVVLRARERLPPAVLVQGAALLTALAAFGPPGYRFVLVASGRAKPTLRGCLQSLHCSALAFFLFSYHVHEKGIIVPLAPLALLHLDDPRAVAAFALAAAASPLPLLAFERLRVAYAALAALYALALPLAAAAGAPPPRPSNLRAAAEAAAAALAAVLHAAPLVAAPPARYPDLYPALTALASAAAFGLAFLYAAANVAAYDLPAAAKAKGA